MNEYRLTDCAKDTKRVIHEIVKIFTNFLSIKMNEGMKMHWTTRILICRENGFSVWCRALPFHCSFGSPVAVETLKLKKNIFLIMRTVQNH
jgi:hypothetical protein